MAVESKKIQKMFDDISSRYDLLNRVLSFRRDVRWRKKSIQKLGIGAGDLVLDLACGTGDMILMMPADAFVIGADFSKNMLKVASDKVKAPLVAADATVLPFGDNIFNKLTITFGFRNVEDKQQALKEMYRVLKPGGKLCILEFSKPKSKIFSAIYWLYFDFVLPLVGRLVSGHESAYKYLPESVKDFPPEGEYRLMIERAGFGSLAFICYDFGICTAAIANKSI